MKKEVMVTISGLHMENGQDGGQDTLELVHVGTYYKKNGAHYVVFEELIEGMPHPTRNLIKIRDGSMEIRKRGIISVHMILEEGSSRQSLYQVPYGSFQVETRTTSVRVDERDDALEALVSYKLLINGEHTADCDIRVFVQPREQFCLS